MQSASLDVPFLDLRENPELYRGNLFALGGIIVNTRVTEKGSLIEAVYVPVDSRGYLRGIGASHERFLALWPKERGILDPMIYRQKREITIAGEFKEIQRGKIDDLEYSYPVFEIVDFYLWEERPPSYYYYPPPYPYGPYWGDYPYYWYDRPYWRFRPYYWW